MIKNLYVIDFDGTLMNSPHPEYGKKQWEEYYGKPYPHIGWWSKPESLDTDAFDIKPFKSLIDIINESKNNDSMSIILTSRRKPLEKQIKKVLSVNNISVDFIDYKTDNRDKGKRLEDWILKYPTIDNISCYDDNIEDIKAYFRIIPTYEYKITFNIYSVNRGNIVRIDKID